MLFAKSMVYTVSNVETRENFSRNTCILTVARFDCAANFVVCYVLDAISIIVTVRAILAFIAFDRYGILRLNETFPNKPFSLFRQFNNVE